VAQEAGRLARRPEPTSSRDRTSGPCRVNAGGSRQKKPRSGGALSFLLHRFERPGSSLSACAERTFRIQNESGQRTGTSRHHEHLNFAAETCGADAPASIVRPACSSTRHIVPDNYNKLGAAVTRARVDPQISVGMSFQLRAASAHHCLDNPPGKSRKLLFGRYFRQLIVLIPKENTMSQFVDNRGATVVRAWGELLRVGASAGQAHGETHAAAVGEVGGRSLTAVELGDQSHDIQAETKVRLAVGAGARLPQ